MKGLFKAIFRLIFLVIFLLFAFAGIDYYRLTKGELPVFQVSQYNSKKRVQTFVGTFYKATRKVRANPEESLYESSKISYYLFGFPIDLKVEKKTFQDDFSITVKNSETCSGKASLFYADLKTKVYTYCLDEIHIKNDSKEKDLLSILKSDPTIIEDMKGQLAYMGLLSDNKTEQYDSRENYDLNVRLYQCNDLYVSDVIIGPKDMSFQNDFCTFKDDDFKFLYQIKDESPEVLEPLKNEAGEDIPEVFYEDETYRYEFDLPKSSYIYVTVPENRGRAEKKIQFMDAVRQGLVTLDELESKISFTKINKLEEKNNPPVEEPQS
jgi:hypothetical protein